MVFFTCNNCGESVKKPAVEKHYQTKCRYNAVNVSCMDCLKDFGDDFVQHTKCISEAEKYSGKNYVPKEHKNSGEKKQESWMNTVRSILESNEYRLDAATRSALENMQTMNNVPRKKARFEQFAKNCMRLHAPVTAKIWTILEKELEKSKQSAKREAEKNDDEPAQKRVKNDLEATNGNEHIEENGQNGLSKKKSKKCKIDTNGNADVQDDGGNELVKKKSKKSHNDTNGTSDVQSGDVTKDEDATATDDAFVWSTVLEKLLKKHSDGIFLEKLKGKMQKKYVKKLGSDNLTEKQQKKFEKKFAKHLKNCPQIHLDNDMVRLC